jgi:hypothetical protein
LFEIHDNDLDDYVEMNSVMLNIDMFGVLHLTSQVSGSMGKNSSTTSKRNLLKLRNRVLPYLCKVIMVSHINLRILIDLLYIKLHVSAHL